MFSVCTGDKKLHYKERVNEFLSGLDSSLATSQRRHKFGMYSMQLNTTIGNRAQSNHIFIAGYNRCRRCWCALSCSERNDLKPLGQRCQSLLVGNAGELTKHVSWIVRALEERDATKFLGGFVRAIGSRHKKLYDARHYLPIEILRGSAAVGHLSAPSF